MQHLRTTAGLLACLILAAFVWEGYDFTGCWLPWSEATHGWAPWRAYEVQGCNYPALALYALTAVEALRQGLGIPAHGLLHVWLIKLPFILPYVGGALALGPGLVWAAPLVINAFVWGQADAVLAVLLVAGVLDLARERPWRAGLWLGLALALKLQAVIVLPAVALYAFRRGALKLWGTLAGTWVLLTLPMALAGAFGYVFSAYFLVVGAYPALERNAFNAWFLVDLPARWAGRGLADNLAWFGTTPKAIGLALLALNLGVILARLWREPTAARFRWAAAMSAFAFFLWPTQIHERYLVPAAALAWLVPGPLFRALCVTASLNQLLVLGFDPGGLYPALPRQPILACGAGLALANLAIYCWAFRSISSAEPSR